MSSRTENASESFARGTDAYATIDDAHPLRGVNVLIVDDQPFVRWAVAALLTEAGASVTEACDGEQAIVLAANERFDLLLTDMEMPGLDGADVAFEVSAIHPEVGVVFMSGRPQRDHVARRRLSERDRFVEKPFAPGRLIGSLILALAAARQPAHRS